MTDSQTPISRATDEPTNEATAEITAAPFFNDPLFQEFYKRAQRHEAFVSACAEILTRGRYTIDDTKILRLVVEDAFTLYDIATGRQLPSTLFTNLESTVAPDVFRSIILDLGQFVASRLEKVMQEMAPVLKLAPKPN